MENVEAIVVNFRNPSLICIIVFGLSPYVHKGLMISVDQEMSTPYEVMISANRYNDG